MKSLPSEERERGGGEGGRAEEQVTGEENVRNKEEKKQEAWEERN